MAEYHKIPPQAPLMYDARKAAEQNGRAAMAWFAEYEQAAAALTEAQATIARLEAALAPFAEAADECDEWGHDDENQAPIDAAQCRAARAALSPGKGE
jgi:hypothetical protein